MQVSLVTESEMDVDSNDIQNLISIADSSGRTAEREALIREFPEGRSGLPGMG